MELFKSLFKYVALLACLVFAVLVVGVGAMFISAKIAPKTPIKIFGYSYFEFNEKKENSLSYGNADFHTIQFDIKNMNLEVNAVNNTGMMHLNINNKMWGVVKTEENAVYGTSCAIEDGVLKIAVNEPKGVMLNTASSLIKLELTKSFSAKNIVINAVNSNISIGDSNGYLKVNDITATVKNAKITVNELSTTLNNFTLKSNNNKTTIKPIIMGELNAETKIAVIEATQINTVKTQSENLQIVASTVVSAEINSKSGIVDFDNCQNISVNGNVKTTIENLSGTYSDQNRTNASLKIKNAFGEVTAKSTSGEVKIENANSALNLTTTIGNVTVSNANNNVNIITTSGVCKVNFIQELSNDATLNFTAKNGSITATNIAGATNVNINNDGVCVVNLQFRKLVGENVISAQKGNVEITAPIQANILNITSNSNKDISYADLIQNSTENVVNKYISGATEATETKLTISATSGKINLKSQN